MNEHTKDEIFSTPKELRIHKINRVIFLFVLIVAGIHILCALNTTYNGYSLAQIGGRSYINRHTNILYFGIIPVWVSNIFYVIYIVYGILFIYGVTGIIGMTKRK